MPLNRSTQQSGAELFKVTLTPDNLESVINNAMIDGKLIGDWWIK